MVAVLWLLVGLVLALLVPVVVRLGRHIAQVQHIMRVTKDIPGPRLWPVVGCLSDFLDAVRDMHGFVNELVRKYGATVRMRVLDRVVIVVMDPDDVQVSGVQVVLRGGRVHLTARLHLQVVCTHPALVNKASQYEMLHLHLGMGLVTMNGPSYKRHRKAISPSLHLDILQDFVPTFAKNAEAMAQRLEKYADQGTAVDMSPEFGVMANMTIMETVLSMRRDDASDNEYAAMVDVLSETSEVIMWRAMRPW